jgi:C1A family cysteine protease
MKSFFATIAVVGTVAVAALYGSNQTGSSTFLQSAGVSEVEQAFHGFLAKEGRNYGTKQEYNTRFAIFSANYHSVMHHNMFNSAESGTELAMNQFADMTATEFKSMMNGYKGTRKAKKPVTLINAVPTSVDWRQKNAVTPVKNQQQCGSCWAFSTTGSIEGAHAIKTGKLVSLSEQQLVDCSKAQGNQGCNGGLMDDGFTYAEGTPLELESSYPYTAKDGTCHAEASKEVVKVSTFHDVAPKDPVALQAAAALGPVSIAIDASGFAFQLYRKGIMKSKTLCGQSLDHGVLLVGYGSESGTDYWIVKNSWGPSWGESGYFRILRDMTTKDGGVCGLQQQPSYPVV